MAEASNPNVRRLRLHWFSVRPSFDLLNPVARTELAKSFLDPQRYYEKDQTDPGNQCRYLRLGRRFQRVRKISDDKKLRPHGFWGTFMTRVAHTDYRGPWCGLAPKRILFNDRQPLRVDDSLAELSKVTYTSIRAYPSCYLFPIGWSVGLVLEMKGEFAFEQSLDLIQVMRNEPIFKRGDKPRMKLSSVLAALHGSVRSDLILPKASPVDEQDPSPYLVFSPQNFDNQAVFGGEVTVNIDKITDMLAGRKLANKTQVFVTGDTHSLAATVFQRGTLVLAAQPTRDRSIPGCATSNLKNSLLFTMLLERFYQTSSGHSNELVLAMRTEVKDTFRQLATFWLKPHFKAFCATHTGVAKMLDTSQTPGVTFNFKDSTFDNVAIGVNAKFIQNSEKLFQPQSADQLPKGQVFMATFNNQGAQQTNIVQGDTATFIQNNAAVTNQDISTQLGLVRDHAAATAATPEQKADADKLAEAAQEAAKGNKSAVRKIYDTLSTWGKEILPEVLKTAAVEGIKLWMGV